MPENTENNAFADYVTSRSDAAFARLIGCHVDMVFGCAMRRTGDRQLSEEISQNVFAILGRKAHKLSAGAGLAGWLHKTTLYETKKALRGESRRNRKMKALAEHALTQNKNVDPAGAGSGDVLPLVDEAIDELPDGDQQLLLMRFFEGKNFREIALETGKSEAASQKQASRALDKLSRVLKRRGVVAATSALGSILAAESAKSGPAGVAATISSGAATSAASLSTTTLITNAIQTMTYAKTKIAVFAAAAAAVPIGAQWNSIGNLKQDIQVYEAREVEFKQQEERLATLEKQIQSLPPGLLALYANGNGNSSSVDLAKQVTAGRMGAIEKKLTALGARSTTTRRPGGTEETSLEEGDEILAVDAASTDYAEMMKNPAMRALMRKQMEAQLEISHGSFIRYISDDKKIQASIKELLLARQLDFADEGLSLIGGGDKLDDAKVAEITSTSEKHDEKLREVLGETGWEEFQRYEDSATERQQLSTFRDVLEENGGELSFETEQQLMAIMHEERMNQDVSGLLETDTGEAKSEGLNFSPSPETMKRYAESQRILNQSIRARVGNILSSEQLKIFEQNQDSHLKMIENSMDMRDRLFLKEDASDQ